MAQLVQTKLKQGTFIADQTANLNVDTKPGSFLFCFAGNFSSSSTVTNVSDPVNGNWIKVGTDAVTTSSAVSVWVMPNARKLLVTQNVTVTSGAGDQAIVLAEFANVKTNNVIDPLTYSATDGVATGTGTVSPSLTTVIGVGNLMICGSGEGTATTTWNAPNAPWVNLRVNGAATFYAICTSYRINNDAPGPFTVTISETSGTQLLPGKLVAFQQARRKVGGGSGG